MSHLATGALPLNAMLLLPLLAATPLAAQRPDSAPARPPLAAGADTNDAQAYYALGLERLRRRPQEASAAFYWATRLDPQCAGCVYSHAIAELLADGDGLQRYWFRDAATRRQPRYVAVDSLRKLVLTMDPFLFRRLDGLLIAGVVNMIGEDQERRLEQYIMRVDSGLAGMVLYSKGRFAEAAEMWGRMMTNRPKAALLRIDRARAFFLQQRYDSARAMMSEGLRIARERDADSIRIYYESKAVWEYSLGVIYRTMGANDSARAAFERTVMEDLSFAPAHIQLGQMNLERGDTAAALREFGAAVSARESDYVARLTLAFYLATTAQLDSAVTHLRHAITLEPHAAAPRLMLASVLDAKGDAAGAMAGYHAFLARATRNDPDIEAARERMVALRGR